MTEIWQLTSATTSLDTLVEAVDRLLQCGVTVCGDVTIGIADIDLVRVDLRALLIGIGAEDEVLR